MSARRPPLRGLDIFSKPVIKARLRELNDAFDGPGEIAIVRPANRADPIVIVSCWQYGAEEVVTLPGDGKPFPLRSYCEALRVSLVQDEK